MLSPMPGSPVQGIPQARILEWIAIPFSRGSSPPRGPTQISHIVGGLFTTWATREEAQYSRETSYEEKKIGFRVTQTGIRTITQEPCSLLKINLIKPHFLINEMDITTSQQTFVFALQHPFWVEGVKKSSLPQEETVFPLSLYSCAPGLSM